MANYKHEQEYIMMPFGPFRGKPFPELSRDFLASVRDDELYPGCDNKYPGLRQSISDFLNGGGYWASQATRNAQQQADFRDFHDIFGSTFGKDFHGFRPHQAGYTNGQQWYPPTQHTIVADRALAKEIISAGRKAMAMKHHPDNGGSEEKMKQYNMAADWLEGKC